MSKLTVPAAVPAVLQDLLTRQKEKISAALAACALTEAQSQQLDRVLIGSDYVCDQLQRHPELLAQILPELEQPHALDTLKQKAQRLLDSVQDETGLSRELRVLRRTEMVRIIWRDLNRLADLEETTRSLSDLADTATDLALCWLHTDMKKDFGTPVDEQGSEQMLTVIGMGKLGAQELNLSSDIDLIFTYPENGETSGGRRSLSNQEFFSRLGKRLIRVLDAPTADGFVFRVDMRLRPFGSSGPLVCSFAAMEHYYQDQGRDWERYALIKARVIAGDHQAGAELMEILRPFVYRKYIDFSAFESLREMKEMINRENRIRGRENNIKLGAGGIREIEFIAQAFQLIRGGRDSRLQQRELKNILPLLPETVGMPAEVVTELLDAYRFLRNTEHGIQALADKQTQELPGAELDQARIAWLLAGSDWAGFMDMLNGHRSRVSSHFADVIAPAEAAEAGSETEERDAELLSLWNSEFEDKEALHAYLAQIGFSDVESAAKSLLDLRQLRTVQVLQSQGQERLLNLLPKLLRELTACSQSELTLQRILKLIQAVVRRSAYLLLLAENPGALKQLVRLCSESAWFAEQLSRQPVLLDELIDARALFNPPQADELKSDLQQHLLRIPEDDIEQLMEALRYFKNAHLLRVAAADITGALPLMKVSDYLTWLAEAVLEAVLEIAWRDLTQKYGIPTTAEGEPAECNFIVVGYGKLGGIELSYGSDLDLVFIHNLPSDRYTQGGDKELANGVFFTRLGQRIIHMLNTFTPSGQLYEVDMRLRPSGNSGLLVSSLEAFHKYQTTEAWTWEHQALVRARVVAGSAELSRAFDEVRGEILAIERADEKLRTEVIEMRDKMRKHLGSAETSDSFNLKQDVGGIVDIEFSVQYLVLKYAHACPALYRYTDNIRILDALAEAGYLDQQSSQTLKDAYIAYRSVGHRQTLQNEKATISGASLTELRDAVSAVWNQVFAI